MHTETQPFYCRTASLVEPRRTARKKRERSRLHFFEKWIGWRAMESIRLDNLPGGGINGDDAVVEQINVVTFAEGGKDGVEKERESWGSKVGLSFPSFPPSFLLSRGWLLRPVLARWADSSGWLLAACTCCGHTPSLTLLSFSPPPPPPFRRNLCCRA